MKTENINGLSKQKFAAVIAVITWASLLLQFFIKTGTALNFFSFFTVQNNLLIAICTTVVALGYNQKGGSFFLKPSVQTALALYIFIVAFVYNTVLRGLVPLSGWGLVADSLLHVVNPILYLIFWWFHKPGQKLKYYYAFIWVIYPFIYLVYSLVRGAYIGWYPYPFLNVEQLGYQKVGLNILLMSAAFLATGFILIVLTRNFKKAHK